MILTGQSGQPTLLLPLEHKIKVTNKINIFWFRRDLRLHDNAGLFQALTGKLPVLPIFIFDTHILRKLKDAEDRRVSFIYGQINDLKKKIEAVGSSLKVFYGSPMEAFTELKDSYTIENVFCNRDYEPYAIKRDMEVKAFLKEHGVGFQSFKDHVVFEANEVLKSDGKPYTVFTPYSKRWLQKLEAKGISAFASEKNLSGFVKIPTLRMVKLETMGFRDLKIPIQAYSLEEDILLNYDGHRDFPALDNTSRLGIFLRFGIASIREAVQKSKSVSLTFLKQLIWRDFFIAILYHFPHVKDSAFKKAYNYIDWINNTVDFYRWCEGETGYPLVDAGMRQLNQTGYMHNRVRMVAASFLSKHLLIDWRWGEAYFAEKLLDFELASNNGGWQWAAGCGCDAAPYFRIFNPESQQKKFDKDFEYIKKWIPEFGTEKYPEKIIDHSFARERALTVYKKALKDYN